MLYANVYNLILGKNLLEFFFNNYYFYNFNSYIIFDYSFFYGDRSFFSFFSKYSFIDFNFFYFQPYLKESLSENVNYNTLFLSGYSYTYDFNYIINDYFLNTAGRVRFNNLSRSYLFFNKESSLWLNYVFFFFENYETTHIRLKKKVATSVISSDLRLGWYKSLMRKYYDINFFQDGLETFLNFNFFKMHFGQLPFSDVSLKLSFFYKNFIMDLKLFLLYEELPSKVGLNFLTKNNYLVGLEGRVERGIKFSLYNNFIYQNLLCELNTKFYGSFYTTEFFKLFSSYSDFRTDNHFSNLFNMNQFLYKGNRYTYSYFFDTSYLNYFLEDSLRHKLDYLYDTLFFDNLKHNIVLNINNSYFKILKYYELKA